MTELEMAEIDYDRARKCLYSMFDWLLIDKKIISESAYHQLWRSIKTMIHYHVLLSKEETMAEELEEWPYGPSPQEIKSFAEVLEATAHQIATYLNDPIGLNADWYMRHSVQLWKIAKQLDMISQDYPSPAS